MQPHLRHFIDHANHNQGTLRELATLLPADDAELDQLIGETVEANDQLGFVFIVEAALAVGRRVDARHLVQGAKLMPEQWTLGSVAWHCQGDVPEALLDAVQSTRLLGLLEPTALFLAAAWCKEHRDGRMPPGLVPLARTSARRKELTAHGCALLVATADLAADSGVIDIIVARQGKMEKSAVEAVKEAGRKLGETTLGLCRRGAMELVPAEPRKLFISGHTMRRAVARVGRNDPCPCGSGKKYKHCCIEKDQERLHHSSDVAGKTVEELSSELEQHLTPERLEKLGAHDLARLDPRKIDPELLEHYFMYLASLRLLDRAAEAFELLGWSDSLQGAWKAMLFFTVRAGRRDVAARLVKIRPDAEKVKEDLRLGAALLLEDDHPERMLKILEQHALKALQTDDTSALESFAHDLLFSRFRALGIFVARGMVQVLPRQDASFVFEELLQTRDKLNLPPDDPFSDIMDKRFLDERADEGKDAAALREARHRLDAKAQEVRALRDSLERMQAELRRREKPAPVSTTVPAPAPAPVDEGMLKEMRDKVEKLKSALKERHHERNDLRRALQQAQTDLDTLRQNAAPTAGKGNEGHVADHEEDWLLPEEPAVAQPLRTIEFPRRFHETLAGFPRQVGRGALTMLGRLAAGEPAAFVGAVRLKACPSVLRHRIGIDFRLLFRLLPDRVQVVDLIPRQDLERKIKTLV